jgi:Nitroreductase family
LSVLEAARWAPSSRNEQPWRYIVFTSDNPEMLKKAQSVLKEINDYAKRAPILICAITKKTYSENGKPNRLHFHDLGAANENMFLEAFNQDLIMHEMGGFDVQKASRIERKKGKGVKRPMMKRHTVSPTFLPHISVGHIVYLSVLKGKGRVLFFFSHFFPIYAITKAS